MCARWRRRGLPESGGSDSLREQLANKATARFIALGDLCDQDIMPISVTVTIPAGEVYVVEMPDEATVLDLKEQINLKHGFPVEEIRLITLQASRMLKNDELLNSDPRFAKLKIMVGPIK